MTKVAETQAAPEVAKVTIKKRAVGVTQDAKLTVLVTENPKRAGSKSFDRFEGYLTEVAPTTVKEALDNGLVMGDIHYDFLAGSIEVEGATIEEYTPTKREPKADSEVEASTEEVATEEDSDEDNF